ncbi:MAG: ABC transporter ATP-binding protein/permease [Acidipropionibacterium sp.]|jgi:ATP-binding cassette subfamily B protein|nr:ABC transporter ATP-binding protein/permease [Acidipropionibacterium sp.]
MTEHTRPAGRQKTASPLSRILRPVRGSLAIGIALQVLAAAISVVPYLSILGLTRAMAGRTLDSHAAWRWVFIYLIAVGVQAGLSGVALLVTHFADVRLQALVRLHLADHLGRLPLGWFDATGSGRVRKVVNDDVESLHQLVAHSVVEITAAIVTPVAGLALCFALDWRLGIAAVLPLILYMVTYQLLARGDMRQIMDRIAQGLARVSQAIVDYVGGVAVLKVFGRAREGSRRFRRTSDEFIEEFGGLVGPQMRAQSIALLWLAAPVVALVALAAGVWAVSQGWTDAGRVLVVGVVALSLPSTLYTVAAGNQSRSEAEEAAGRVIGLLDEPVLPQPADPQLPADASVEFRDVHFSYPPAPGAEGPGHRVINGVSLRVPSGGSLALVGPSGAGKSTLALLAARFRDVDEGAISIGGVDVRRIDESVLRSRVGVVLQTVQLPALSVAENISLGRPDATREQIEQAARAARIHDRISRLPRGYDSVIGDDALLSGGEAQRVAIARVLLQETPVLILDEATSAADPETEWEIQQALTRLVEGRTLVMIAHRLNTVRHVDVIAVVDDGRIVESGSHEELLARGGRYAQMWQTQMEVAA